MKIQYLNADAGEFEAPLAETQARRPAKRLDVEREEVDKGLAQLVLTLLELIRQLMERQALRRVERGVLTAEQEEQLGLTLMRLDEKMDELREIFELEKEDINLDLGPLGNLL